MSTGKLVDVHGITKVFRSKLIRRPKTALRGLDLTIGPGEIFGFLGPNGAGKTTTIKILLGLIRPTAGEGTVLGRPFGSVEARRDLGFLPDAPNFYRYLSAYELMDFVGKLHGLGADATRRRIEDTLDRVGLEPEARKRQLRTYSRGMLQRTGIAAAILHRPRLVILDEPLNGLDPLGRRDFRDLILSLRDEGISVFLSSHVLGDIENTADRVGIVDQGRLIRCGALEEILSADGRRIEIHFVLPERELPPAIGTSLRKLRPASVGWIGEAEDAERASAVVADVLAAGGRLLAYQPQRVSLEEFFMSQVDGDAGRVRPRVPRPESAERARPLVRPVRQEAGR